MIQDRKFAFMLVVLIAASGFAEVISSMPAKSAQFGKNRHDFQKYSEAQQSAPEVRAVPAENVWFQRRLPGWSILNSSYDANGNLVGPFKLSASGNVAQCPFSVSLEGNKKESFAVVVEDNSKQVIWEKRYLAASENRLTSISCSPEGRYLLMYENAVYGDTQRYDISQVRSDGSVHKLSNNPSAYALVSPDARMILIEGPVFENSGGVARSMQLIDAKSGNAKSYISAGYKEALAWSQDGEKILFLEFSNDGQITKSSIER